MTFEELCLELGVPFARPGESHHVTQNWLGLDCPRCSPGSKKFKLGYNVRTRSTSCWTCGSIPLSVALSEITGRPHTQLWPLCKGLSGDKVVKILKTGGSYWRPPAAALTACPPHAEYVRSRGFDPVVLQDFWKVRAVVVQPRYAWRLFVPVFLGADEVSWTTRAIHPGNEPRYRNAPPECELRPLKSLLYGTQHVRNVAIVVEGPTDAWRVGPGAVATMGVVATREQILKLSQIPVRYVCYDAEPEAQRQARKLCDTLSAFPGKTANVVLDAKDPGEASPEEVRKLRKLLE